MKTPWVRRGALLGTGVLAAALLGGCVWIKPGSVSLSQPGGIGAVLLHFSLCSAGPEEQGEAIVAGCMPHAETSQGQVFLGLVVPSGAQLPNTLTATPGAGGTPISFARNAEVAQALATNPNLAASGLSLPPAGFEIAGYLSGIVSDQEGQSPEWTVDAELGPPAPADGGSYGGPFKLTVLPGWRLVNAEYPASRPLACQELPFEDETWCSIPEPDGETETGTSDLKISPPALLRAAPGTEAKPHFSLDFASSLLAPPRFALAASSNLGGAGLKLVQRNFSRPPVNTPDHRSTPATRTVKVKVPPTARPGTYEVTLSASTAAGGSTAATAQLTVTRPLRPRLKAPRRIAARVAWRKGVPLRLTMPVAGSHLALFLFGKKPGGRVTLVAKKLLKAKKAGPLKLRLKLHRRAALALRGAGAKLTLKATIWIPGGKRSRFTRRLKLR